MKNPLESKVIALAQGRVVETFYGGSETYRAGERLVKSHLARTTAYFAGYFFAFAAACWVSILLEAQKPWCGLGAFALVLVAAFLGYHAIRKRSRENWLRLTAKPKASAGRTDWRKKPAAAFRAAQEIYPDLGRILEISRGFGSAELSSAGSLLELGKFLARVAKPAHARVDFLQREEGCLERDQSDELRELKELLCLCAKWGRMITLLIWKDQEKEHAAKGPGPKLVALAPFSWPGFPGKLQPLAT